MTKIEKVQYDYCQEAINQKNKIEKQFWTLAEMLHKIKTDGLYLSGWSSWEEYCMEFKGFSKRSMDKIIQLYKVFILEHKVSVNELQDSGGWALLAEALPHVHSKKDAKEWIEKSKILTLQDIRKELKERKTGISMVHCKHRNTYTIRVCEDCGERIRIYEDNEKETL